MLMLMMLLLVMIARAASFQVEDIALCATDMRRHVLLVVVVLHTLHRLKHLVVVEAAMKEVLVTIQCIEVRDK